MWKLALQIRPLHYSRVVLGGTAAFFIPSGMREAAFFLTLEPAGRRAGNEFMGRRRLNELDFVHHRVQRYRSHANRAGTLRDYFLETDGRSKIRAREKITEREHVTVTNLVHFPGSHVVLLSY